MRRFLRALAGAWLACQIVAVAAPLTLFSDNLGIDQASCCPGVAPGQTCPMHHKTAGAKHSASTTCMMESACAHHDAALLTILAVGVLTPSAVADASVSDTNSVIAVAPSTSSRAVAPDVPPPQHLS